MNTLDLLSPQLREDPHAVLADLRGRLPVCPVAHLPNAWAVLRYDDARHILENPRVYTPRAISAADGLGGRLDGAEVYEPSLLVAEPLPRGRTASLVRKALTTELISRHERGLRQAVAALVDRILERDLTELVGGVALPLPAACMAELLGIEPARRAAFMRWAGEAVSPAGSGGERLRRMRGTLDAFTSYVHDLVAQRRAHPAGDLLSALVQVTQDGQALSDGDVVGAVLHLLLAGNETCADLLGLALLVLTRNERVHAQVREDPSRIPAFLEEVLRWESPVVAFLRTAQQAVALRGRNLPQGSLVCVVVASANRDGAHFADADTFNVDRKDQDHLAFGAPGEPSLHAPLTRTLVRLGLEAMFERLPRFIQEEGEVRWCGALLHRGPRTLPLAFAD
jgi:cytochrome P450